MNVLDIILAIPTAYLIWRGWKHGLVREVSSLAGLLAGLWAATHLSEWVAEAIGLEGEYSVLAAFFITFVGAVLLAYLLGRAIEGLMKAAHVSVVNRLGGAALGMVKALCILAVLTNLVVMVDKEEKLVKPEVKAQSVLYAPTYSAGNRLTSGIKQYIADHAEEWKEALK